MQGAGTLLLSLHNPVNFTFCILILILLFIIPEIIKYILKPDDPENIMKEGAVYDEATIGIETAELDNRNNSSEAIL